MEEKIQKKRKVRYEFKSVSVRKLIEAAGYQGAIALSRAYGGKVIRVPSQQGRTTKITLVAGFSASDGLIEVYGGEKLEIPSEVGLLRELRNQHIVREYCQVGRSISEIASSLGLTRRQVHKIITEALDREQRRGNQPQRKEAPSGRLNEKPVQA